MLAAIAALAAPIDACRCYCKLLRRSWDKPVFEWTTKLKPQAHNRQRKQQGANETDAIVSVYTAAYRERKQTQQDASK